MKITHGWVTSHMTETRQTWMSHVTHEWNMSHMSESRHTFIGKVVFICLRVSVNLVYKFQGKPGTTTVKHDFNPNRLKFHRGSPWVSILSWLNLKANRDYFSYEHEWITSYMNEPCRTSIHHLTCEWVTSHMNLSRHIWMSRVVNERATLW